jgi:hypothetical protein
VGDTAAAFRTRIYPTLGETEKAANNDDFSLFTCSKSTAHNDELEGFSRGET